ncbi:hypothetical protein [Aestuariivirga sp.]|uniref:hypothetical protein n=1 Tax=Aestuariivirga sp. TaxID=2650926 RepID=UPI00359487F0
MSFMDTESKPKRFLQSMAGCSLAVALSVTPALAQGEPVKGAALKSFITGKRIYLATPLGGELPLYYRSGGIVDGSGEAVGLGKYMSPKDKGRWWVSGDRVCQKWKEWYDGRTFCFTLAKLPGNKVFWKRDDGKQGVARIGR